jgi:hypothetical protein
MARRLDEKLARIQEDPSGSREFMICDAKDGDMSGGMQSPGPAYDDQGRPTGRFKTRADHLDQIRAIVRQDIVDLMLVSAWALEQLAMRERLFEGSAVTPAARMNDTTDIWKPRGSSYATHPARAFATPSIDHVMYGRLDPEPDDPVVGADIGLWALTFNDDIDQDLRSLEAFREFRIEAERKRFRYFLEVFNPNVAGAVKPEEVGSFVNDCLTRCLAGMPSAARPLFLKVAYNGPRALEELVAYDPSLVVGILGGGAGTTRDTFELLHQVRRHGARLVLFGRKINLAEDPLAIVALMRRIADGGIGPEEAVRAYHGELQQAGLRPLRPLEDDLRVTEPVLQR